MAKEPEINEKAEDPKSGAKALHVVDQNDHVIREYSYEIHGKDMVKNAEEFAKKFGHSVRKAR